uniref:EF-hand domain-containing protein n=2 Tax=Chrysotila carterae TaxID=13221 RepID=A0A7S4EY68_CHRCT
MTLKEMDIAKTEALIKKTVTSTQGRVIDYFRRLDNDRDGMVSLSEFKAAFSGNQTNSTPLEEVFKKISGGSTEAFNAKQLSAWVWGRNASPTKRHRKVSSDIPELARQRGVRPAAVAPSGLRSKTKFTASNLRGRGEVDRFHFEDTPSLKPFYKQGNARHESPRTVDRRVRLMASGRIAVACRQFWDTLGLSDTDVLHQNKYMLVHRLVSKALAPQMSEAEWQEAAQEDWMSDLRGRAHDEGMTLELYIISFFEIADLWTETASEFDYIVFINKLFRRVTRPVREARLWSKAPKSTAVVDVWRKKSKQMSPSKQLASLRFADISLAADKGSERQSGDTEGRMSQEREMGGDGDEDGAAGGSFGATEGGRIGGKVGGKVGGKNGGKSRWESALAVGADSDGDGEGEGDAHGEEGMGDARRDGGEAADDDVLGGSEDGGDDGDGDRGDNDEADDDNDGGNDEGVDAHNRKIVGRMIRQFLPVENVKPLALEKINEADSASDDELYEDDASESQLDPHADIPTRKSADLPPEKRPPSAVRPPPPVAAPAQLAPVKRPSSCSVSKYRPQAPIAAQSWPMAPPPAVGAKSVGANAESGSFKKASQSSSFTSSVVSAIGPRHACSSSSIDDSPTGEADGSFKGRKLPPIKVGSFSSIPPSRPTTSPPQSPKKKSRACAPREFSVHEVFRAAEEVGESIGRHVPVKVSNRWKAITSPVSPVERPSFTFGGANSRHANPQRRNTRPFSVVKQSSSALDIL